MQVMRTRSTNGCGCRLVALAVVAIQLLIQGCGSGAPTAGLVETIDPVKLNGDPVRAQPAAPRALAAGDVLEVGPKGLARLVYPDGSRFVVLPEGQEPAVLEVGDRDSGAGRVVMKLVKGALAFMVAKERKVKDRYELKALNTVTTIEGTAGRIITTPEVDRVALESGSATVRATSGASAKVAALQEATYTRASDQFKVTPHDPVSPEEGRYYDRGGGRTLHVVPR